MKKLYFLSSFSLLCTSLIAQPTTTVNPPTSTTTPSPLTSSSVVVPFKAQDFSYLQGMPGFSENALNMHFKLYQGYVTNTNLLLDLLQKALTEGNDRSPQYAELKRRLMWEYDGMRLHEDYFNNLGGQGSKLASDSPLSKQIQKDFNSFDEWKKDFIATGAMRGIGWAVLYYDPLAKRLVNAWINEHDRGHLAGGQPLLIMDVFEHAYMPDYGLNRQQYIDAFFNNIDWDVVANRFPVSYSQNTK